MLDGTDATALKRALTAAEVKASEAEAKIAFLKLTVEKLR